MVCIATVCDWLKNLAPISQQIRSLVLKLKLLASYSHAFFPALGTLLVFFLKIWLVHLNVYVCSDWLKKILWFSFTELNCKLP